LASKRHDQPSALAGAYQPGLDSGKPEVYTRHMDELRDFMARHRLTQEEVATAIGTTKQFVSQILRGEANPSLETAKALLAFCQSKEAGMTFERLFGGKAA
jgi:transcriptional regulator with XRE-family HTH domain